MVVYVENCRQLCCLLSAWGGTRALYSDPEMTKSVVVYGCVVEHADGRAFLFRASASLPGAMPSLGKNRSNQDRGNHSAATRAEHPSCRAGAPHPSPEHSAHVLLPAQWHGFSRGNSSCMKYLCMCSAPLLAKAMSIFARLNVEGIIFKSFFLYLLPGHIYSGIIMKHDFDSYFSSKIAICDSYGGTQKLSRHLKPSETLFHNTSGLHSL